MQGRKPTKKQAMLITAKRLNYENWLVVKDLPGEMHVKHRYSDKVRVIRKNAPARTPDARLENADGSTAFSARLSAKRKVLTNRS